MSFIDLAAVPKHELLPGCHIRAPFGRNLMLSYLEMDAAAEVPLHHHPHEQGGILLSGRMALTIGDETRACEPGALYIIPPNVPHRAVALGGPCVVLDVFSPVREDYAALTNRYIPTTTATDVRGGYDRWAAVYDHDGNPLQGLEEPAVRAAVGDVAGRNVLDLGCGTGRHALWLAANGANVTAVDFSDGMLAEARLKPGADRVRFVQHDLHQPLPFADASFDVVVSGLVLEHLRELDGFFGEARRVLKSGGRAVVSAMHPAMMLRGTQARFTDPTSGEVVQPGSVAHSVSAFVMAAVRAGFRVADVAETAPDAAFAVRFPRAAKYVGWPMLVVLQLDTAPV